MRKNWKKFLALVCAAAMVIPSTAPISAMADLGDSYVGDSAIENDNSILPNITNVVLSTITDTTYNFRVDPDQLLNEFNSGLYTSGSMYFENEATPVNFTLPDDYSFYIKSMGLLPDDTPVSPTDLKADSRDKFLSTITVNTTKSADFIAALDATEYYVWQPNDDMIGLGSYVRITADNYMNFIELTVNDTDVITKAVMDATPNLSEGDIYAIWDGGIYVPTYAKVDGTGDNTVAKKIVPLFDVEYGVFDESVYVGLTTIGTPAVYYNTFNIAADIDAAFADGVVDIKLTEATSNYQNISRAASITNKSTFDIAVTASIQMTGGEGLTLAEKEDFTDSAGDALTDGANVYLAVADLADTTNNVVAVKAPTVATTTFDAEGNEIAVTGEASAYYVLKGTGTDNVIYTMGEIEEATQSNIYYRYLNPTTTANKASFAITGKSDTRAYDGTDTTNEAALLADWEGYIQDLANGIATRPQINIVYTFDKVTSADNRTFTNLDLDTFAKADASEITTTGWVKFTSTNKTAGLDNTTYEYTYGDEIDVTYYPADSELISVRLGDADTDEFTVTDNVITLAALNSILVEKAQATDSGTKADVTITVTFVDETDVKTDDGDPEGVATYTATIKVNGTKVTTP